MSNDTVREQPQRPESAGKEETAGAGTSFPFQGRIGQMMAACASGPKMEQMWAACCGKPEETRPSTSGKEHKNG